VAEQVRRAGPRGVLARGLGRSYGDAAQNAGGTIADLTLLATSIEVDEATDVVTCDAGVSLDRLIRELLPRGMFVPVTPGTRQVTVGGAVAADVHGKNHHRDGSIGRHLRSLQLVTGTGEIVDLTPEDDLFHATTGGLGLTGVVTRASMSVRRVPSSWMVVDTERAADLDGLMAALEEADTRSPYSVAWIDCLAGGRSLGRGVVTSGDHAPVDQLPRRAAGSPLAFAPRALLRVPAVLPSGLLRRQSVAAFNEAWFRKAPRLRRGEPQPLARFFHPLDGVVDWNRVYGPAGFVQWQVVVPFAAAAVVQRSVQAFADAAAPAFLAVLKRFGPAGPGHLSFPAPGWTLALDLPSGLPGLAEVLDRLDEDVLAAGGRVYLAKDSRARPGHVAAMYPRLPEWQAVRHVADPHGVFRSDLARRLLL
jgi:decaprenylphospho-beta-D-ribofuranose 2-oxidase